MLPFAPSILSFDRLDSTNDYIKKNHVFLPDHTIVQAQVQTHGKGQFDRVWESEPDQNLLFSLLVKSELLQEDLMRFVSASIIELLAAYGIKAEVRPPNDIYAGSRKIAGILIERLYEGKQHLATVIGIGINVNQVTFQTVNAVSMKQLTNQEFDLYLLLLKLTDIFKQKYPPAL